MLMDLLHCVSSSLCIHSLDVPPVIMDGTTGFLFGLSTSTGVVGHLVRQSFLRTVVLSAATAVVPVVRLLLLTGAAPNTVQSGLVMKDLELFWFIFNFGLVSLLAMSLPIAARTIAERLDGIYERVPLKEFSARFTTMGVLVLPPIGLLHELVWVAVVGLYTFAYWLLRRNASFADIETPGVLYYVVLYLIAFWSYPAYGGDGPLYLLASALILLVTTGMSIATTVFFWRVQGWLSGLLALLATVLIALVTLSSFIWWWTFREPTGDDSGTEFHLHTEAQLGARAKKVVRIVKCQ